MIAIKVDLTYSMKHPVQILNANMPVSLKKFAQCVALIILSLRLKDGSTGVFMIFLDSADIRTSTLLLVFYNT